MCFFEYIKNFFAESVKLLVYKGFFAEDVNPV